MPWVYEEVKDATLLESFPKKSTYPCPSGKADTFQQTTRCVPHWHGGNINYGGDMGQRSEEAAKTTG